MWMSTRDPELLGTGWGAQRGDFSWGRGASTRGKPTAGTTAGWPRGAPKGTQISRGWAPAPHIPRGFPQGLTLADSWDVRVATFSCEDSSSRRSLRICCGERTKRGRGGERGRGARLGCGSEVGTRRQRWARAHLGLHLLLSLAARGQRETDRGGQSGGQRGTAKAQRGAEDMHRAPPHTQLSAPNPTRAPPPAHSHAGGSAARRWLLRRSRWRRRWRPGTAPIRELQQNKSCQEAGSSWGHGGLCGDPAGTRGGWLQGSARSSALGHDHILVGLLGEHPGLCPSLSHSAWVPCP